MSDALDEFEARRKLEAQRKAATKNKQAKAYTAAKRLKVHGHNCRICHSREQIEAHHLVPRASFGQRDESLHNPNNIIPLCHQCHQDHHTTTLRVPRSVLTDAEEEFLLMRVTLSWLSLWYPLGDV